MIMENTLVGTQSVALSKEIETEGFDLQAGKTWIYPTNYPTREYQYNITQKALLKNTLVSLPTGLGKTFIAAVVMYNIYRWYPHGKIIFMAPTKPLVKQQVDACYNIMAIPPEVTAELTGAKASSSRTNMWAEKRVFFVTPQVLQNDLNKIAELGSKIKCLVFDEAHRAKGNHAYCEVIRRLIGQNHKYFRVLALSATPGSNVNDVLEVIQNLLISHVEFRTEESLDVSPYVFQRSLETVVVPLNKKLEEVRDEYLKILEQYVKTLIKYNVVHGNCGSLTKGKIFMIMKDFQNRNRGTSSSNYSEIMRCLNICVTLYHAYELLIRHGLRNFLSFYDEPSTSSASSTQYCDVCQLEVPATRWKGHARTLQLREKCCVVQEEGVQIIKTSFRSRLATYRIQGQGEVLNINGFMQNLKEKAVNLLQANIRKYINIKIGMELFGRFLLQTKETTEIKSFNPRFRAVSDNTDLEELFDQYREILEKKATEFEQKESEHIEKPLLRGNNQLRSILNNVREYLGPIPNIEVLPDGTYPEIPKNIVFGHPKYYKLRDVLVSHFSQAEKDGRVIVFFEYRESVMEAHTMLLQSRPLIQPKIFIGQGSGITQKVQLGVVKAFREGKCNTLLSTCIGEEGLDVGEVDLIVCFDISNKSPIRMVQRMGRTGRKREGRIVVLVTEGKEQQTLKDCLIHKNNISTYVLESKQLNTGMYPDSPRLVPENVTPRCEKLFITVKKIAKKNSIKDMLRSISSSSSELVFSQEVKISDLQDRIPKRIMLFNKNYPLHKEDSVKENTIFYKFIEKQRTSQRTHKIKHSKYTNILTDLLCSADSKRFNIPSQIQNLTEENAGKNLKQSDIRNMFLKKSSQLDFQSSQKTIEDDIPTQIIVKDTADPVDTSDDSGISKEAFTLISNYLFTQMSNTLTECRHCPQGFRCEDFVMSTEPSFLSKNNNWVPSLDILDKVSLTEIENFSKSLDPGYQSNLDSSVQLEENEFSQIMDNLDSKIFSSVNFTQLEKEAEINSNILTDNEKSFNFEAPKTYSNILNKFGNSIFLSQGATPVTKELDTNKTSKISEKSLLEFFNLESLSDIYGNTSPNSSQNTIIYSQTSDLDTSDNNLYNRLKSPSPLDEPKEKFTNNSIKQTTTCKNFDTAVHLTKGDNHFDKQISSISDFCDLSYFGLSNTDTEEVNFNKTKVADIEQICDLSQFGILTHETELQAQDIGISKGSLTDDTDKNVNRNSNDVNSPVFDDAFLSNKLSQTSDKENDINNSKDLCDDLYKKTSTPLKKCFNKATDLKTSSHQNSIKENKSHLMNIDQTFVEMDLNLPYQRSDFTRKYNNNYPKPNFTQGSMCIDEPEDNDAFAVATQSNNSNKTNILTSENNSSKSDFTQKSNIIDDFEENYVFAMATQPNKSNKANILASSSTEFTNGNNFDSSIMEKEIECVDLTILSPTPANEKRILSCESQIPITQMLSLLNKTSQKENLKSNREELGNTLTPRGGSPVLNKSKRNWLSKLSTKKNIHKKDILIKTQSKSAPKKEVDPYLFSINFKNNKDKPMEKSSASSDEFEDSVFLKPDLSSVKMKQRNKVLKKNKTDQGKQCKKRTNEFLDLEAQLTEGEDLAVSEDEDEDDNDFYEKSFVNDETQHLDTQMQAKYLQSVRSPANPRRFKIPIRPAVNISNVYSQPPFTELDTYLEDSFCVDTDDTELTQNNELSQLEILEEKLRKKKKRKLSDEKDVLKPKRRRVICFASDDSD